MVCDKIATLPFVCNYVLGVGEVMLTPGLSLMSMSGVNVLSNYRLFMFPASDIFPESWRYFPALLAYTASLPKVSLVDSRITGITAGLALLYGDDLTARS